MQRRLGRALLAELLRPTDHVAVALGLTLGDLWYRYRLESAAFLDNDTRTKRDAEGRAAILLGFFGSACDVSSLSDRDQLAYTTQRRAGGISYVSPRGMATQTSPTRARSAEADLILLHAMLRWATTVRLPNGRRLLADNPLNGVRRVREQNPKRPVATWERFTATRTAMQSLAATADNEPARARWVKLELALVLAEATGRRLGSIRQLRWEDVDFDRAEIHWRAEADKKRKRWIVPAPPALVEELRAFRRQLEAIGGLMFPGERKPDQPMDRHLFDRWLSEAEKRAGLAKLDGGLWHAYRRKWGGGAQAPSAQGRRRDGRLGGRGDHSALVPAARSRDAPGGDV